jgi:RNA polymerase subunit RPABC4/transcription elongation factor Spt4
VLLKIIIKHTKTIQEKVKNMGKKKAGKFTKVLTDGEVSPLDPKEPLSQSWYGRVVVLDVHNSTIAKKMNISKVGEYAIKVR